MNRNYITQKEQALLKHKAMTDRLKLLLCANSSADLKIKLLLLHCSHTPSACKEDAVKKARLPVKGQ